MIEPPSMTAKKRLKRDDADLVGNPVEHPLALLCLVLKVHPFREELVLVL